MKFVLLAILLSASLLLSGCAGGSEAPTPKAPSTAPPVPGNNNTPSLPNGAQAPPAPGNNATPEMPPGEGNSAITADQLAAHNVEGDCWFAYKGKVYDTTNLIPNHKNYKELLVPLCGTSEEFETAFEGKHGLSKVQVLIENSELKGDFAG